MFDNFRGERSERQFSTSSPPPSPLPWWSPIIRGNISNVIFKLLTSPSTKKKEQRKRSEKRERRRRRRKKKFGIVWKTRASKVPVRVVGLLMQQETIRFRTIVECNPAIIRWSNYHKKGSNFTQYPVFFFFSFFFFSLPGSGSLCVCPRASTRGSAPCGCRAGELHVVDNGRADGRRVARPIDFHDFSISFFQ